MAGPTRAGRGRAAAAGCLLIGAAIGGFARAEPAAEPVQTAPVELAPLIVTGDRTRPTGVTPERTLDEEAIAGYGLSTVEDLLAEVAAQDGDGDETPVIMVNGKPVADLADVADLPVEAVSKLQVLPRGSAVGVGGSAGARVYNMVLRRSVLTRTATLADKGATQGDWDSRSGALTYTRIMQQDRLNAALRLRHERPLLESDRGLTQPAPSSPFDLRGNLVADPRQGGDEIDPALSALAGRLVTVAPVPQTETPDLADFTGAAPNVTDAGRYRTLRPKTDNLGLTVAANQRLTSALSASFNGRVSLDRSDYLFGLPSGLVLLPADNVFSPFSRDVAIAAYAARPLTQASRDVNGNMTAALNATFSPRWYSTLTGRYGLTDHRTTALRQSSIDGGFAVFSDPLRNPFAGGFVDILPLHEERARSRTTDAELRLSLSGQAIDLPAGPLRVNLAGAALRSRSQSDSAFTASGAGSHDRRGAELQAGAQIPIAARDKGALAWLGELNANLDVAVTHFSDVGALRRSSYGVIWSPARWVRLDASRGADERPPQLPFLFGPVIVTSGVRYFDVLTGQTVDVTAVNGANPALGPERVRTDRLQLTVTPLHRLNLQLNAAYTAKNSRGAAASLPGASAAVMAAFPDRFVRDAAGRLTLIDVRPVALERRTEEGVSLGFTLDAPLPGAASSAVKNPAPKTRLQLSLLDTWALKNEVVLRQGLPVVDLLRGGALGFGGGLPTQQMVASAGLSRPGLGVQLSGAWRSATRLKIGEGGDRELRFDPFGTVNLRAFADLRTAFPQAGWAKGARLTLAVTNLTDARQRVRDETGITPLRYQPAYLDPIGRAVELELRKSF